MDGTNERDEGRPMGNHEPIGDKELAAQSEWIQHMRGGIRHCPYGHPLDRKNLIHRRKTDGSLQRRCREGGRCRALAAYHRKHPDAAYRSDEERRRVDQWERIHEQRRRR